MFNAYLENTLRYDASLCIGCGPCSQVCPHGVFDQNGRVAFLFAVSAAWSVRHASATAPRALFRLTAASGVPPL